ncbi:hypothetical protein SAMD00079811_69840 [Scytonema sp. HK-05]|uniref:hypothetical protein n=1 Tax=Scytonema sp. HK-05 TaxID=1137095 RepID=UPI000935B10B|nr:hypothetical protein [Scytonema sp. HK-05]OKH56186.1 hypothetical protein NIES2130_25540 [Scytonema sp. HK-05]BAY49355.1 hypothetical protein SAMD00079811_69840 [Scytonema sp. HK-05]
MNPIEASDLKAFVLALYQLNAPLPDEVQTQVNQINIPADIGKLYEIAMSYPPLAKSYNQVQKLLDGMAEYRSKGVDVLPQPEPEQRNTEIDNSTVEIIPELVEFENKVDKAKLVEFENKVDSNKLTEIARQITQALNSVSSAKDVIQTILS